MKRFQTTSQSYFEDIKKMRQELLEDWTSLIGFWPNEILCSWELRIPAGWFIVTILKTEVLWILLLFVLFIQKIKNKMKNFKDIHIKKDYYTLTASDKKYKLRLTESAIMQIEEKLDKPIYAVIENIWENMVETIATIIWATAQTINKNFSYEKAMSLFDDYIDDGNSTEDLIGEIYALFESSDYIKKLKSMC